MLDRDLAELYGVETDVTTQKKRKCIEKTVYTQGIDKNKAPKIKF